MMNRRFKDIAIVDLDIEMTRPSRKGSGLRQMYLELSRAPRKEWVQLFMNERRFPRHTKWRDAWIDGSHIVVDCVPEEIAERHLEDLKHDVANANKKYRESPNVGDPAQESRAEEIERIRLEELRRRLDFSEPVNT